MRNSASGAGNAAAAFVLQPQGSEAAGHSILGHLPVPKGTRGELERDFGKGHM